RRKFLTVFERAKLSLKELNDFLTKEYVKTKSLEETFQLIDKLQALEEELAKLGEQKKNVEAERALIEKEISEIQKRMDELKSKGGISQLSQLDLEIEALNVELKHNFQHLQKPFIKLQSLALHGEGSGLTPEEINKLNQYLEKPLEALSAEEAGYPLLKQILQKLTNAMTGGKLKLKSDKMRKAEQAINNILNKNSLAGLHQKCINMMLQKKQLSTSAEVAETRSGLLKLQENLEKLEQKKRALESEESSLKQTINATLEKMRSHKNQIEKNIFDFAGKKVRIG
ncbi:MAG: hypothetical protein QMD20_04895, partial [Candidatus Bathyarchaeia archaeon]|nr:hypothetical protein [Candidatus Bathyarchaeia archaeon]